MILELRIQTFAVLRDLFGPEARIQIEPPCSARDVVRALARQRPEAGEILASSRLAVGTALAPDDYALTESDIKNSEIFILPPASGG